MKHYELKHEFQSLRLLGYDNELSSGYFYNPKEKQILKFKVSKNKKCIILFLSLRHHIGLPSRHDKYLKVYKILELLKGKPSTACRAIRVSISHSSRKITDPKLVEYLLANFGELEISLKNYRQNKLFYDVFTELVEATYSEILNLLDDPEIIADNVAQKIIKIVDSAHLEYKNNRYSDSYQKIEYKLGKYIARRSNSIIYRRK